MLLPSDLFKFKIRLDEIYDLNQLVESMSRIKERKGWYFNTHYMHEQIFITSIDMNYDILNHFIPYIELFSSINVVTVSLSEEYIFTSSMIDAFYLMINSFNDFSGSIGYLADKFKENSKIQKYRPQLSKLKMFFFSISFIC